MILQKPLCFSRCGDNCVPFLFEISEMKAVTITLNNAIVVDDDFEFYCENDNNVYNTIFDFVTLVMKYTG